jgi:hypothetical protein
MPTGKQWLNFIYINIAFAMYIGIIFYYTQVSVIKENWPLYRCNPVYMPLADDIQSNFVYCIQTMQSNYMGYLLEPLNFVTGSLGSMLGNMTEEVNNIRAMFNKIRSFISDIIQNVFGVFLNLVIEFQRINISIIDLIGKTIGIMTTLLYTMDGSIKTMNSTWNGPPGQLVKSLGKCFYPYTQLKLKNEEKVLMCNIRLGDILEHGEVVEAILQIDNKNDKIPFYKVRSIDSVDGEHKSYIFVTGSHLIYDKSKEKFVKVSEHPDAIPTDIYYPYFYCLITDNHKIPIGGHVFWDWEDHFMKVPIMHS